MCGFVLNSNSFELAGKIPFILVYSANVFLLIDYMLVAHLEIASIDKLK